MKKVFLSTLLPLLALSACGHPEPISYESLVWVNNYYIEHPVASLSANAGGWLFRGAREFETDIRVDFLAQGSMDQDPAHRQALLRSICPAKSEVIWQTLPSNNKIVINVWIKDRKIKDSRVC